jgi:iron complex outermembrane receptor protein
VGPANLTGRFGNTLATAVVRTVNGLFENPSRHVEQDQFSQELQLLGSLGNFQYVVGGYYFREDGSEDTLNNTVLVRPGGQYALYIPSRAAYSIANKSYAAFGQLTWKPAFFASRLELTGGVRFTTDEKYLQQTFATARIGDQSYDNTSMLASVNYQWTDDFMTYARYTTGFRSGGFNTRATGSIAFAFQPEKAKTSEVGFKAEFFAQRLRVNGSAYYTDYSDLQVSQFLGGTGGAGGTQINANAHYAGFELEAQAVPIDGLTLTGSVGYVDPKYDEIYFAAPPAGATAPGCTPGPIPTLVNCANIARFIYVSDWTAAAGINYVLPAASYGEWAVRTDYNYRSRRDYHSTNLAYLNPFGWTVGTPAYGLLSARVTLSDIRIAEQSRAQISAYVDNLADKKYVDSGIDFGSLGFGTAIFGARRSYGVELKASF